MRITIERKEVKDIPVLEVDDRDAAGKKALVLLFHGFGGKKEDLIDHAQDVAMKGYFCVCIDTCWHGELETEEYRALDFLEKADKMFEAIEKTSDFIDLLIEAYAGHKAADASSVGLMGFSMGGQIVYHYLATTSKENVKAAVPVIATPLWSSAMKDLAGTVPGAEIYFNGTRLQEISTFEPSKKLLEREGVIPVLMINGVKDHSIKIEEMRQFYSLLRNCYKVKDKVRFAEFEGKGHYASKEMLEAAYRWLNKYLNKI
ncbi:MAG: alpha/beta fold hydrolase [Clostridia bacterium]|nr:alpha/beta fold hydrolase [Clostridia bacterium]